MPTSALNSKGFTLIEIIIGIVVFAFSLSIITSLILPTTTQSANQLQQIRAAELGQSLMNEIIGKAFDENSDRAGGLWRCGENLPDGSLNPCSTTLGAETGETRVDYDDVDDYHNLSLSGVNIENVQGQNLGVHYQGFEIAVNVIYDGNYDGVADSNRAAKRILITVTSPAKDSIEFSSYKANF